MLLSNAPELICQNFTSRRNIIAHNGQRVVIVTGASKGIGAAIAQRLARDNIAVVVNYATNSQSANDVVAAIAAMGGTSVSAQADIASLNGIASLFAAAELAFGPVDILVNNAAIMKLSPLIQVDDESFRVQVETNLGGVFRGMREAGKRLRNGGRIIIFLRASSVPISRLIVFMRRQRPQ